MGEDEFVQSRVNECVYLFKTYNIEEWGDMYFKTIRNFLNAFTDTSNSYLFRKVITEMIKKKIILKRRENKRYIYQIKLSSNHKKKKDNIEIEW